MGICQGKYMHEKKHTEKDGDHQLETGRLTRKKKHSNTRSSSSSSPIACYTLISCMGITTATKVGISAQSWQGRQRIGSFSGTNFVLARRR